MCCTSIFTCIIAMISNFLITFTLDSSFKIHSPQTCHIFAFWCDFSSSFVNGNNFFLSKSIIFYACFLKEVQNIFIKTFPQYKCVCFLCGEMPKLLILNNRKENAPLFLLLKTFLDYLHIRLFFKLKIQCPHK